MAEPTKKQNEFVAIMARTLGIDEPMDFTLKGYSQWIEEHIDAYDERIIEKRRDEYRRGEA